MSILDWYIARIIAATSALSLMILVGLSSMLKFVQQLKSVGHGSYELVDAGLYVLLMMPRDIELFFPMAALLGALIGLGMMASSSELVVMQAAGISRFQIIVSVMKTAVPLMLLIMALGEWGAPWSEQTARNLRAQAISGGSLIKASHGLWAKDGERFVHIGEVEDIGNLRDVSYYDFNDKLELELMVNADTATFNKGEWLLKDVKRTYFQASRIEVEQFGELNWKSTLTPDKLGVVTVKPESLSVAGLSSYLDYLDANKQDPSRYELAFWRKLLQPLTIAVMMLLALSFIFGPLRSVSMGARLVMGVVTGFAFHLANAAFGPISLVYNLPPILGALLPSLLFFTAATYLLNRAR